MQNFAISSRMRKWEPFRGERGVLPPQCSARKEDGLGARRELRLSSWFALTATILPGALLWTGIALADETLLRGPRKAIRAAAETADSSVGNTGALESIAAAPVRFYQRFLAPHWGNRCVHHPSCSRYALLAIRKHGTAVGLVMTFDRLQHESNEARYSPLIRIGGETKVYDPLENNDYWWYRAGHHEPASPEGENTETNP